MTQGLPDLEAAISATDLYSPGTIDWRRARRAAYLVQQHLCYTYPGPVHDLQQCLKIIPPDQYGDQRCLEHRFQASHANTELSYQDDTFGNREIGLFSPYVEHSIIFEAWVLVERRLTSGPHYIPTDVLYDPRLLTASALTQPDDALRQLSMQLLALGKQGNELAQEIMQAVYAHISYTFGVTHIRTTAAEAFALGKGVCQDYAHIMLALCHLCNLPARYVSGHLLGEGGTHAWVEVLVPTSDQSTKVQVIPFDPTHNCLTDLSYLTIAVGRDYFDVAPTSGTFRAAYGGELVARKRVKLAHFAYEDDLDEGN